MNSNPLAAFSSYKFAADGTVTKNGKVINGEASPKGEKFRLTDNDGQRKYVYATDIIAAVKGGDHAAPVQSETVVKRGGGSGKGVMVDLSNDDEDATPNTVVEVGSKKKSAAPKKAASKAAAPKELAGKKAAAPKKAPAPKKVAAPKKAAIKKEVGGPRDWEVLSIAQVGQIKKDLVKRQKLIDAGDKAGAKEYSYSALATKYSKSNSCIVNINFGRIHKDVSPAK